MHGRRLVKFLVVGLMPAHDCISDGYFPVQRCHEPYSWQDISAEHQANNASLSLR